VLRDTSTAVIRVCRIVRHVIPLGTQKDSSYLVPGTDIEDVQHDQESGAVNFQRLKYDLIWKYENQLKIQCRSTKLKNDRVQCTQWKHS
jgi:triacylglycerol esterase/lipase EstA (alpha/beta hydrolase family)